MLQTVLWFWVSLHVLNIINDSFRWISPPKYLVWVWEFYRQLNETCVLFACWEKVSDAGSKWNLSEIKTWKDTAGRSERWEIFQQAIRLIYCVFYLLRKENYKSLIFNKEQVCSDFSFFVARMLHLPFSQKRNYENQRQVGVKTCWPKKQQSILLPMPMQVKCKVVEGQFK